VASVLVAGTNGIVVQAGPSDVVILRNLRINGIGSGFNGIRFLSGKALGVENCVIFGFTTNGIDLSVGAAAQVWIQGTTIANVGGHGVSAISSSGTLSVSIDRSHTQQNSGFGVLAGANSKVVVTNTTATGNSFGFVAQPASASAEMDIQNSTASNNGNTGIFAGGGAGTATIRVAGNSLFANGVAGFVVSSNGSILSYNNNFNSSGGAPSGAASPGPQ